MSESERGHWREVLSPRSPSDGLGWRHVQEQMREEKFIQSFNKHPLHIAWLGARPTGQGDSALPLLILYCLRLLLPSLSSLPPTPSGTRINPPATLALSFWLFSLILEVMSWARSPPALLQRTDLRMLSIPDLSSRTVPPRAGSLTTHVLLSNYVIFRSSDHPASSSINTPELHPQGGGSESSRSSCLLLHE